MKVLFIYTSSGKYSILGCQKFLSTGAYLPPLGMLYLGKMLEINGHAVEIIDYSAEGININSLKGAVLSCDAVGMTIYSSQKELNNSVMLSNLVKKIDPHIPLLIGGPHCSLLPEQSLQDHHADVCVKGPGEFVINPIVESLEGKRKLSTISGICYREGNRIRHSKPDNMIRDLDKIPFPARHLVEKYEYGYVLRTKMTKGKLASILTSRGCPHYCRFCELHNYIPLYQVRSISNITAEIEEIINEGYKTLAFVDDNFLAQKEKVEKIMDFIIQKRADIKLWVINARADSAEKNLYEKMRDAGVEWINFGIESGNQDVLNFYNKKLTLSQIRETVNLSKEMGFFVGANFILGAPIETKKHIENTIKFAKSIPLNSAIFYILGYSYGTQLWEDAVNERKNTTK
ncbi:Fe-S oxidoreductase [Thermoplasmatales archaeon SCGC AB-539-C06]|nr:Fe-S oxidoreductase [Thermoplasmatales archaeon SCGC AB-539-C06]